MNPMVLTDVDLAIPCAGNVEGLLITLSSILNGSCLPGRITVAMNGEFPAFSSFYLEQLADVARIRGVIFSVTVLPRKGIRFVRDWMLENSKKLLWMSDDDLCYNCDALEQLVFAYGKRQQARTMLCGNKRDVNNRRAYGDFTTEPPSTVPESCAPTYAHYDVTVTKDMDQLPSIYAFDSGFCLVPVELLVKDKLKFSMFSPSVKDSGGEDSLFGLQAIKLGYSIQLAPMAQAYHLEKPRQNFKESSARAEMVLRAAQSAQLDGADKIFPWIEKQ